MCSLFRVSCCSPFCKAQTISNQQCPMYCLRFDEVWLNLPGMEELQTGGTPRWEDVGCVREIESWIQQKDAQTTGWQSGRKPARSAGLLDMRKGCDGASLLERHSLPLRPRFLALGAWSWYFNSAEAESGACSLSLVELDRVTLHGDLAASVRSALLLVLFYRPYGGA